MIFVALGSDLAFFLGVTGLNTGPTCLFEIGAFAETKITCVKHHG